MKNPSENENLSVEGSYDLVIIGGGPAGLNAAMYASRADLNTMVLDKSQSAGALGHTGKVENFPGVPKSLEGKKLLSIFKGQAEGFGAKIVHDQVIGVDFTKELKEVYTGDKTYSSKAVIVATGSMGRKPSIKGEADFIGKGISYCATCDAPFFKDMDVAIVGGLDEVIEELDAIARFAKKTYVVTWSREMTSEQREIISSHSGVELLLGHQPKEVVGNSVVEGLEVTDSKGSARTLDVSGVFVYLHGNKPIVDFLQDALATTDDGCIDVQGDDMSTSVEGVFAVGDVTCKKLRQVVVASAQGCTAALSADKYINSWNRVRSQWS